MIGSGLFLWGESIALKYFPKYVLDIAHEMHSDEAMLATLDPERRFDHVEAIASAGQGVFETLKAGVVIAMGIFLFGADLSRADLAGGLLMVLATVASYSVFGFAYAPLIR